MKRTLIALEILIIVVIGGYLVIVYSGWYNIAATDPHFGIVKWTLETTMENSVRRHAREVVVPPLESFDQQTGLRHFDEMCVLCHGAPGVKPSEIGKGQNPEPPDLAEAVQKWMPQELFWIVRHGIKMTGMPGFGPTHADEELWAIVAFIRRLPEISPEEYLTLTEQLPRRGDHMADGHHAPGAEAPPEGGADAPPEPAPAGEHRH